MEFDGYHYLTRKAGLKWNTGGFYPPASDHKSILWLIQIMRLSLPPIAPVIATAPIAVAAIMAEVAPLTAPAA